MDKITLRELNGSVFLERVLVSALTVAPRSSSAFTASARPWRAVSAPLMGGVFRTETPHPQATIGQMRLDDGRFRFSPTDLNAFLACEHLTTLQLAVARGELDEALPAQPAR